MGLVQTWGPRHVHQPSCSWRFRQGNVLRNRLVWSKQRWFLNETVRSLERLSGKSVGICYPLYDDISSKTHEGARQVASDKFKIKVWGRDSVKSSV